MARKIILYILQVFRDSFREEYFNISPRNQTMYTTSSLKNYSVVLTSEPTKFSAVVSEDVDQSAGLSFLMGPPSPAFSEIPLASSRPNGRNSKRNGLYRESKKKIPSGPNETKVPPKSRRSVIGRPGTKPKDRESGLQSQKDSKADQNQRVVSYLNFTRGNINTPTLFSRECLCAHNYKRQAHGMPSLKWSADLATQAQNWANEVASGQTFPQKLRNKSGENIYISEGIVDLSTSCLMAVNSWYNEGKDYNYKKPGLSSQTGLFISRGHSKS